MTGGLEFVQGTLKDLIKISENEDEPVLKYLLEMAYVEVLEEIERRGGPGKSDGPAPPPPGFRKL